MSFQNITLDTGAALIPNITTSNRSITFHGNQAIYRTYNNTGVIKIELIIDLADPLLIQLTDKVIKDSGIADPWSTTKKGLELCKCLEKQFKKIPAQPTYQNYKTEREAIYQGTPPSTYLGSFYNPGTPVAALCRERAFIAHLILAEAKIPNRIAFGTHIDPKTAEKSTHAWIEYHSNPPLTLPERIWDPTQSNYLNTPGAIQNVYNYYNTDQQTLILVKQK